MRPERGLLAFAIAVFVLHQLPAPIGEAGTWVDLATPLAVLGAAAWALRGARGAAVATAVVGAVLYVDGHGIHLAANDIRHEHPTGSVEDVAHFWDERFGHIEWHLGCSSCWRRSALPRPEVRGSADAAWRRGCSSAGRSSRAPSRAATGG